MGHKVGKYTLGFLDVGAPNGTGLYVEMGSDMFSPIERICGCLMKAIVKVLSNYSKDKYWLAKTAIHWSSLILRGIKSRVLITHMVSQLNGYYKAG